MWVSRRCACINDYSFLYDLSQERFILSLFLICIISETLYFISRDWIRTHFISTEFFFRLHISFFSFFRFIMPKAATAPASSVVDVDLEYESQERVSRKRKRTATAVSSVNTPQRAALSHSGLIAAVSEEHDGIEIALQPVETFSADAPGTPDPATQEDGTACTAPLRTPFDSGVASPRSLKYFDHRAAEADVTLKASEVLSYLRDSFSRTGDFRHSDREKEWLYDSMLELSAHAVDLCRRDERRSGAAISVTGSAAIIGDLHGDFEDLLFLMERLTVMGELRLTPHSLIFLGDFVDRGRWGVEVCAFVIAVMCSAPTKVVLLRGNHDDPSVNSAVSDYAQASFRYQCALFSGRCQKKGDILHVACNKLFRVLPMACVLDRRIFCAHGGIPRYLGGHDDRLAVLSDAAFPEFPIVYPGQCDPRSGTLREKQMLYAWDLMWSDPVEETLDAAESLPAKTVGGSEEERERVAAQQENGFGSNVRGGKTLTYSSTALKAFLDRHGFDCLVRGHQERQAGVRLSHNGRLLTVFSTSGYCNHSNNAGAAIYHADTRTFHYISKSLPKEHPATAET